MIATMNRHLLLLAICQGLFLTNNVTFIAINGLVGLALAPLGWMATLPVTAYVVGAALSAMPVSRLQARAGRKRSFQVGLLVAIVSAATCALAVMVQSFWLLVAAFFHYTLPQRDVVYITGGQPVRKKRRARPPVLSAKGLVAHSRNRQVNFVWVSREARRN